MSTTARRLVGLGELALGAATLWRPRSMARAVVRGHGAVPDPRIVRVLGARQVAQGVVTVTIPRPEVAAVGIVVDLLHAASLLPVALFSPRYRRVAAVSAALAATAALLGWSSTDDAD